MAIVLRIICILVFVHGTAAAAPRYSIKTIGLQGSEYTRNDGYAHSTAWQFNSSGQVIGRTMRFSGDSQFGNSTWLYDGANTYEIGLAGVEHTHSSGLHNIYPERLNNSGHVVGRSIRYNGGAFVRGTSVWFYDGLNTINIGLSDEAHTESNGARFSRVFELNDAGHVSGLSDRYNGNVDHGQTAWRHYAGVTIDIGLSDDEHTKSSGYRWSSTSGGDLNARGDVIGYSDRYVGGLGRTAWIYNGLSNVKIGLFGPEHVDSSGKWWSDANSLNDTGQVVGRSRRYIGGAELGFSAWHFDGVSTLEIGLTSPEHTRNDGYRFGDARLINNYGKVVGGSERFNGGSVSLGINAWLYNGTSTVAIGLTDTAFTRLDGYKSSTAAWLNQAGQVSGRSERFLGQANSMGRSTWYSDGVSSIEIGLIDGDNVRSDGFRFSSPLTMNELGQIAGYSERYRNDGSIAGQDAWFYDPVSSQTIALSLSSRSDGYAYSNVHYLSDHGIVLGSYTLFDESDVELGNRAFYFSTAEGLHDLGSLVAGGLPANGWDWLADTFRGNSNRQIVGHGKLSSQSGGQSVYLLTQSIPEPTAAFLALIAVMFQSISVLARLRPRCLVK